MELFKTIIVKDWIYFWRYKVNAALSLLFSLFICVVLLYLPMMDPITKEKGDLGVVAPYFMWLIMSSNFTINQLISSDSITGVTEQLYVNTSDYLKLLLLRCISSFLIGIIPMALFVVIISLFAKINLMGFVSAIPFMVLGIPAVWGLSLVAGALVLRFKRVDTAVTVIGTVLFAGVAYFSSKNVLFSILMPFAYASRISSAVIRGAALCVTWSDLVIIIINSVLYLFVGVLCFRIAEKGAKRLGILGNH